MIRPTVTLFSLYARRWPNGRVECTTTLGDVESFTPAEKRQALDAATEAIAKAGVAMGVFAPMQGTRFEIAGTVGLDRLRFPVLGSVGGSGLVRLYPGEK